MRLLGVEGLTKRFGGLVAVNKVDFGIEEGSITAVMGAPRGGPGPPLHPHSGGQGGGV
jgi:ABC-type branched-subunit amino acid transport system ATPase component